ncbi:MAG: membrane protein insertase YidC [Fibrobacterales bacterium]
MKKSNILGFVLLGVMILWMSFFQEPPIKEKNTPVPQKNEITQSNDNTTTVNSNALSQNSLGENGQLIKASVSNEQKTIVETEKFIITLSNKGAVITSIILKDLKNREGINPELFEKENGTALGFSLEDINFSNEFFTLDSTLPSTITVDSKTALTYSWKNSKGYSVTRTYTFSKSGTDIAHDITIDGYTPRGYTLNWGAGLRETERITNIRGITKATDDSYAFSELIYKEGDDITREEFSEKETINDESGTLKWIGLRRKYIAVVINFDRVADAQVDVTPLYSKEDTKHEERPTYTMDISENLTKNSLSFRLEVLPLKYSNLQSYDQGYEEIIVIGYSWFFFANVWFPALCGFILWLLNFFYGIIPNYGIAIILLTIVVKTATLPFGIKQTKSMTKMKEHKPAIDAIRAKYKSDPKKVQEKTMAYYREKGINPLAQMGGCLPMVMQMPIFISLFVILGRAVELRYAPFAGWIQDLSLPDVIYAGIEIPLLLPHGIGILPFIMAASSYIQAKQTMTDPNQAAMIYLMPAMMFFFSNQMPSGLVVYWIVQNLYSITQHWVISKKAA